jgi:cell wall-associated NlpC family hydrolase
VHGGQSEAGIDCSGLVRESWAAGGVDLPHNAAAQALWFRDRGALVPWTLKAAEAMEPADAVFFRGGGGATPETLGHCALFITHFEGLFIVAQATQPGVGTEVIRARKYEPALFIGYMR